MKNPAREAFESQDAFIFTFCLLPFDFLLSYFRLPFKLLLINRLVDPELIDGELVENFAIDNRGEAVRQLKSCNRLMVREAVL